LGDVRSGQAWLHDSIGRDVLAPVVGWGLLHDGPVFLLGYPANPQQCKASGFRCRFDADRARVQEAAVAGSDVTSDGHAHAVFSRAGPPFPVFNAALNESAGRVLLSPLALGQAYSTPDVCPAEPGGGPVVGALESRDVLEPTDDVPLVAAA